MDSSPMDISLSSPQSTPSNSNSTPNLQSIASNSFFGGMSSLNRVISSSSPTSAHLRNRTRRPSSLSLGLNLDKMKGFVMSSPSSGGSGNPGSGGGNSNNNSGGNGGGTLLPATNIGILETGVGENTLGGRGRASSTASSMSFGFSPSRRSISLEDSQQDQLNENEETPQARKRPSKLSQMAASLKRRRQVIGITGNNESEGSLSARSDGGRATPDVNSAAYTGYLNNASGFGGERRGLEVDVDALVVDTNRVQKDMTMTPPKSATELTSPFPMDGPFKPSRLLRLKQEDTALLETEAKSEAAFARLVSNTSDLASRLRLNIANNNTPGTSPARRKRNWMENWANSTNSTPVAIGGNEARSNNGNWAGRFPEMVQGDAEGSSGDTDSDDGDPLGGTANNTLIPSRPNSVMGQATSVPMGIPISNGMEMGRSRSGSTVGGDMMIVGSYGMGGEFAEMDLDMASNMSSPISTPLTNSWREPAPFFQSKKRKFSAAVDQERTEFSHATKKRKGLSPHGTLITLSSDSSSGNGSFVFPQPKSPYSNHVGMQLSMTSMGGNGFPTGGTPGWGGLGGTSSSNPGGNGGPAHRKSGSMSTMAWSRPGSAHSSPLLRPTTGNSGMNMPAPGGLLLGPTMLSNSTTAEEGNGGDGDGQASFSFSFPARNEARMAAVNNGYTSYPPGTVLGQFGAPLTSSPSSRPMVRLPERALAMANLGARSVAQGGNGNGGGGLSNLSEGRNGDGIARGGGIVGLSLDGR